MYILIKSTYNILFVTYQSINSHIIGPKLQKCNGWNILPSLTQKSKVFFFPNASHVNRLWKHKKEFKTNPNREKVRNHNSGDGKKKEKKEKKKKEEEIEVEDEDECREFVTGNLCWVASLLLQLRTAPVLSSSSPQFVFLFPHKSLIPYLKKVQSACWPNL